MYFLAMGRTDLRIAVFLGKERKILAPRSETEKPSLANGDIPQDPPISQPDKYQEGETLRRVAS